MNFKKYYPQINRRWKQISRLDFFKFKQPEFGKPKFRLLTVIVVCLVAARFCSIYFDLTEFVKEPKWIKSVIELVNEFLQNSWIELVGFIIVFTLIEEKIEQIILAPDKIRNHTYKHVLKRIKSLKLNNQGQTIRILDIDFTRFSNEEEWNNVIKSALEANPEHTFQILLLHPETFTEIVSSMDYSIENRTILTNMKTGIAEVYKVVQKYSQVEAKLYKTAPAITYASWDDRANFSLLYSDDLLGLYETYQIYRKTSLGEDFNKYFKRIWSNDRNTVELTKYYYCSIIYNEHRIDNILWGGASGLRETPRFIQPLDNMLHLDSIFRDNLKAKKHPIILEHNNKRVRVNIIKSFSRDGEAYKFASDQIGITYGNNDNQTQHNDVGNFIYEIEHFSQTFHLRLKDFERVSERLLKRGYAVFSHREYDLNLNYKTQDNLNTFLTNIPELLERDEYDIQAIEYIKRNSSNYINNPRKRLFLAFECNLNKGIINISQCKDINEITTPFSISFNGYKSHIIDKRCYNTFYKKLDDINAEAKSPDLSAEERMKKQGLHDKMLICLRTIISTIKADILYLLGESEFIRTTKKYKVYVNILRTEVANTGIESIAYPKPEGRPAPVKDFSFKVIHLLESFNIEGGVTHIKNNNDKADAHKLENSLDVIFLSGNTDIEIQTDPIVLKEGASSGFRDVLVIEFRQEE